MKEFKCMRHIKTRLEDIRDYDIDLLMYVGSKTIVIESPKYGKLTLRKSHVRGTLEWLMYCEFENGDQEDHLQGELNPYEGSSAIMLAGFNNTRYTMEPWEARKMMMMDKEAVISCD